MRKNGPAYMKTVLNKTPEPQHIITVIIVSERVHTGLLTPEQIIPVQRPAYDRPLIPLDYIIEINHTSRVYTHKKWSDRSFGGLFVVFPEMSKLLQSCAVDWILGLGDDYLVRGTVRDMLYGCIRLNTFPRKHKQSAVRLGL